MQALIDTISRYWDAFINYFNNVFLSLKTFLLDLPILAFKKIFEAVTWLFTWASDSCSYCFSGADSLPSNIQDGFNSLSPAIAYCLDRSGFADCMRILTCGIIIWSVFKVIGFIKGIF